MQIKPIIYIITLILIISGIKVFHQYLGIPKEDIHLLQDEKGFPYIQDTDSYFYYHKADIKQLDDGLSFFAYYWHRFLRIFNPDITLMGSMGFISLFFFGLTILNIFFIIHIITNNYTAGFFGSLLLAINQTFFLFTWNADTNTLIYFFVTAIVLFFIFILNIHYKSDARTFCYAAFIVVLFYLFRFTWEGWYFILFVMALSILLYMFSYIIKSKNYAWGGIVIFLSLITALMIVFIKWPFKGYISSSIKQAAGFHIISELHEYGIMALLLIDKEFLVIASIIFCAYLVYKKKDMTSLFLAVWFFLMIYATSQSFRFIPFVILAYSIIAGIMLLQVYEWLDEQRIVQKIKVNFLPLTFIFFFAFLFASRDYNSNREILVDDAIYSLGYIDIPENATILNNWDYGHIIRAFTGKTPGSASSPPLNDPFKEAIVSDNKVLFTLINLGNSNPYIIFTEHDLKTITFLNNVTIDSTIIRLITDTLPGFELYYKAETPYNWVMIWRLE